MKKSSLLIKVCSVALISVLSMSLVGCSSDKKTKKPKESEVEETTTAVVETAPTTAATTIPTISGPDVNDIAVSWQETALSEPVVKYVSCNEFINVRKGPGTDYDAVTKFTNNMSVTIVATTDNGWAKTHDGFYVSNELLKDSPS